MSQVSDLLKRAAEKGNFNRERFDSAKQPTDMEALLAVPFFGDLRSTFIFSSLLLHKWKEVIKPAKYLVLCSWPGCASLFPYADEYWSPADNSHWKDLQFSADGFSNQSLLFTIFTQNLNGFFRETCDYRDIVTPYYKFGLQEEFWETYKNAKRFLPATPSAAVLGREFNHNLMKKPGYKVFVCPSLFVKGWRAGRSANIAVDKGFWSFLLDSLVEAGYTPVVWQNYWSYDLSPDFTEKCVFFSENDLAKVLTLMRSVGLVIDVFQGLSRLAFAARCACVCFDERSRFTNLREFEIDDVCNPGIPVSYNFTFSTLITETKSWKSGMLDGLLKRLHEFLPSLEKESWPNPVDSWEEVSHEKIREIKRQNFGLKLFHPNTDF